MQRQPLNLILLGDPASGKATQAERLVRKYKLYNFDMGKELRNPVVSRTYAHHKTSAQGKLAPTDVVRKILKKVILSVPKSKGILMDGHPKMLGEAKVIASLLKQSKRRDPYVIYLKIPKQEAWKRAHLRKRPDDSKEALNNRARYYRTNITQVIHFFRARYPYKKISGEGSRSEVFARIDSYIKSKEKRDQ